MRIQLGVGGLLLGLEVPSSIPQWLATPGTDVPGCFLAGTFRGRAGCPGGTLQAWGLGVLEF